MPASLSSSSANFSSTILCCFKLVGFSTPNVDKYERNGSRFESDSAKSSLVSWRLRTSARSASFDGSGAAAGAIAALADGAAGLDAAGAGDFDGAEAESSPPPHAARAIAATHAPAYAHSHTHDARFALTCCLPT